MIERRLSVNDFVDVQSSTDRVVVRSQWLSVTRASVVLVMNYHHRRHRVWYI